MFICLVLKFIFKVYFSLFMDKIVIWFELLTMEYETIIVASVLSKNQTKVVGCLK